MQVDKDNKKDLKNGTLVRFRKWTCEVIDISQIDSGIVRLRDIANNEVDSERFVNAYACHILSIG